MAHNIHSNSQTSLVQPIIQITEPISYENFGDFSVSAHTDIGNRKTQEDRFIIVPNLGDEKHKIAFFGVFDGTVGHFSSDTIQKIIIRHLTESQEWENLLNALYNSGDIPNCATEAMFKMYKTADEELLDLCSRYGHDYASSTSVTVLLVDKFIVVGHLGDSRVSICYEHAGMLCHNYLTIDHKPNNPEEKMRIIASGGSVEFLSSHSNNPFIRGGDFAVRKARGEQPMQLQYSRAFGGKDLKKYGLSSNPDITVVEKTDKHHCIILASDGLWDIKSVQQANMTALRARGMNKNPARFLIESALERQRSRAKNADNITAIVVFFNTPENDNIYNQSCTINCQPE